MSFSKNKFLLPAFISVLFLPACEMYHESWVEKKRVQVAEERYYEQIPVNEFSAAKMDELAKDYSRYGDGTLVMSVTYNPASKTYPSLKASSDVAKFSKALRNRGVRDLKSGVLPVQQQAEYVLISFTSYKAEAPEDCRTMQGFDNPQIEHDPDYKLGCTVETLFARQIARPKDLKGQDDRNLNSDGRRVANALESYRDGAPSEPLSGESASEQ